MALPHKNPSLLSPGNTIPKRPTLLPAPTPFHGSDKPVSLMELDLAPPPGFNKYSNNDYGDMGDEEENYDYPKEEIDSFASNWGVEGYDDDNEENASEYSEPQSEYSNALSKLRGGQKYQPQSMMSALEKLRNFNKRGFNDPAPPLGLKRFKSSNNGAGWFDEAPGIPDQNQFNQQNNRNLAAASFRNHQASNRYEQGQPRMGQNNFDEEYQDQESQNSQWNRSGSSLGNSFEPKQPWQSSNRHTPEARWSADRRTPEDRWSGDREPLQHNQFLNGGDNMGQGAFNGDDDNKDLMHIKLKDSEVYPELLRRRITTESEREYLEGLVTQWKVIVNSDYDRLADLFKRDLAEKKAEADRKLDDELDLGTLYADFRLNMRVYDLTSGQEKDVFTSTKSADGNRMFKCEICGITVTGKRNLETHLMGKKHLAKLGDYSIVGKNMIFYLTFFVFLQY